MLIMTIDTKVTISPEEILADNVVSSGFVVMRLLTNFGIKTIVVITFDAFPTKKICFCLVAGAGCEDLPVELH